MSKIDVKIKDYKESTHLLNCALRMVGFNIGYEETDLIESTIKLMSKKGDQLTILDASRLQVEHGDKFKMYQDYFDTHNKTLPIIHIENRLESEESDESDEIDKKEHEETEHIIPSSNDDDVLEVAFKSIDEKEKES